MRADHDRLEQVLVNLIGNAVTHTPAGTRIEVTVGWSDDDHVSIRIRDDGPGMPDHVVGALFRPGVRGDAKTGAGLGLSIAHGIVVAHGGTLDVTCGHGTTFTVCLPLQGPDVAAPAWSLDTVAQQVEA